MYQALQESWAELTAPGAPFEITPANVLGRRANCYANAANNLREFWLSSAAFAERDYLVYQQERWTYTQAHQQVASIANWLVNQGVESGDRVGIAMRNYPEWLLGYWACQSIGAVVVGMNAWWVGSEMTYALEDAQPKVLIADQERLSRALEIPNQLAGIKVVGVRLTEAVSGVADWSELLAVGGELPEANIDSDQDACIFYTSGTTGRPKGAQLTHRGCVHNVMSMAFWGNAVALALHKSKGAPLPDPETAPIPATLVTTPLFHVTANNCAAQGATLGGGKLVHMYRWDAGEALKLIEAEAITSMTGVPTMAREVINHPDFAKTDTSSLLALSGGGAQLPPDLVGHIDKKSNSRPGTGWGMTETCGIITSNSSDFFVDKPDSVGPAMPDYEVKCVDEAGNTVAQGELGEIWVRGPQVIKGYINRPEATAESITDGWLHTGDVAQIDEDGFIYIKDRVKDMVLRGGENVYCAEVENALYGHDAVAECSVFAIPDDRLGEEVGAAVHLKPGVTVDADTLRSHAGNLIAKHKLPRYLWILAEPLPRNASGKFLRRELKEQLDTAQAQ